MKKAEGGSSEAPKSPRKSVATAPKKSAGAGKKAESPEKAVKSPAKKTPAKAATAKAGPKAKAAPRSPKAAATAKPAAKAPVKKATASPAKKAAPKTAAAKSAPAKAAASKASAAKAAPAKPKAAPKRASKSLPPADLAHVVAAAAMEHKLIAPVLLNLTGLSSVADWFFIATAENARQMGAIADKIIRRAKEHGSRPLGREGQMSETWALVDLGDVIVHLFSPEARELYDLEGLWADAPREKL